MYGNDASGDDVELQPVGGSGARTQALYDTAGINTGAGGLITPMQRVTPVADCTGVMCTQNIPGRPALPGMSAYPDLAMNNLPTSYP